MNSEDLDLIEIFNNAAGKELADNILKRMAHTTYNKSIDLLLKDLYSLQEKIKLQKYLKMLNLVEDKDDKLF